MPTAQTHGRSALLALPWLAGSILALSLAWLPLRVSLTHFLYEDYFYYLGVAEQIIGGNGVTFDGEAKTNGFHPAWMLLITLIRALAGHTTSIHVGLTLAALLHVGQAALIFLVVARLSHRCVAYCAAVLYLVNYRNVATNLCGLETPLAGFALLGTILFLVRHRDGLDTRRDATWLGVLLGLAIWSRFDLALFALAIGAWTLLSGARRTDLPKGDRVKTTLVTSAITAATCAVVLLPWFLWSLAQSGVLLPNSRAALAALSAKQGQSFSELIHDKLFGAAWWLTDTANALGLWPTAVPGGFLTNLSALLVVLTVFGLGFGLWKLLRQESKTLLLLATLFIYAIVHAGYYGLTLRLEIRYLMPFVIIVTIVAAVLAGRVLDRAPSARTRHYLLGVAAVLLANGLSSGIDAWRKHHGATRTHANHGELLDAAHWLTQNTPEGTVVGAWNAGVLSYFSGRQVVNLDGVINDEAIEYNRRRAIDEYIETRDIRMLADVETQIATYMDGFGGIPDWRDGYETEVRFAEVAILKESSSSRDK